MKANLLLFLLIVFGNQLMAQQGWQYQNSNLSGNLSGVISPFTRDTVFVMADPGKFCKTTNGGSLWVQSNTGSAESFFDMAFVSSSTGYAVGTNGAILKTSDGGNTWTALTSGTTRDLFSVFIVAPDNIWVVGDSGVILTSLDFGSTWQNNNALTQNRLNSVRFRNFSNGYIAGNAGTLLKTTNGGSTWNLVNLATTKDFYALCLTGNYAYMLAGWVHNYSYGGDELYRTTDNIFWTHDYLAANPTGITGMYFRNDSLGFTITSNCTTNGECFIGISKTTDFGQNWQMSLYDWNPPSMVGIASSGIAFVTDSIGYALSGDNILKTTDGGTYVSVRELVNSKLPRVYPNPATDKITLRYPSFNSSDRGLISIFNSYGQLILQEPLMQEKNDIMLPTLSKGVYFLKVNSGDKSEVVKFVIE
ncbi:MAG: YCF48-related protein [Bacteroidales bacterium]